MRIRDAIWVMLFVAFLNLTLGVIFGYQKGTEEGTRRAVLRAYRLALMSNLSQSEKVVLIEALNVGEVAPAGPYPGSTPKVSN